MNAKKVCYIWDVNLIRQTDRLPAVAGRASIVDGLIEAYGLHSQVEVVESSPASYEDLKKCHSELYLNYLQKFFTLDKDYMITAEDECYGLGYDCPPLPYMYELVATIAGGSVSAADCLMRGVGDVAINWCGGWHHASKNSPSGFCYVNDIVIAIETLRTKFPKVLYIDFDVHHGDGVQDAYKKSNSVFTLSFHKYEAGFYPGTGNLYEIGSHAGTGYCCNVPLREGYCDATMEYIFEKIFPSIFNKFAPSAIVVQCGADALSRDPFGGACLTERAYCACVETVLHTQTPTLLLGGGGYDHTNTARLWTSITAVAAGVKLDEFIPEHDNWPMYRPGYVLPIESSLIKDRNNKTYLDECIATIQGNLVTYLQKTDANRSYLRRQNKENERSNDSSSMEGCSKQSNDLSSSGKVADVYTFDE